MRIPSASERRGGVLVWVIASLGVLLGIVAIGLDGGRMMEERRRARIGADAAALAAADALSQPSSPLDLRTPQQRGSDAALPAAAANGFNNDGVRTSVTFATPPTLGLFAGKKNYVEVTIQSRIAGSFGAAITRSDLTVNARAVARIRDIDFGILTLDPTKADALLLSGNGVVNVNGSINVNSSSAQAYDVISNARATALIHNVVGNVSVASNSSLIGPVNAGATAFVDPFAGLPFPSTLSAPLQSVSTLTIGSANTVQLQPGVYRGGISISGQANVTFAPGTYIMDGGGFHVSGQANLTGSGVLLANTGSLPADSVTISGNGATNLTPPASGRYAGIVIVQDRADTQPVQLSGNGSAGIIGVVYAPTAAIQLTGNSTVTSDKLGTSFVGLTMSIAGNGNIDIDPNKQTARQHPVLAE